MRGGAELDEIYETEQRLLYVACTRAQEHLMLSGARHPRIWTIFGAHDCHAVTWIESWSYGVFASSEPEFS